MTITPFSPDLEVESVSNLLQYYHAKAAELPYFLFRAKSSLL